LFVLSAFFTCSPSHSSQHQKKLAADLFPHSRLPSTTVLFALPEQERRDPRFSNLSGSLDPHLHSKAYSFLPTMLSAELTDLQASLKVAKKAVLSAPRHERRDKEAEVERIEMELGKVRTRREREARERREREAVGKWKKEERAKRGEGKKEWHLKDGESPLLLLLRLLLPCHSGTQS
jgi:ribosomal RNA-processing protein 36